MNDEARMTENGLPRSLLFGLRHFDFLRHSTFVLRHWLQILARFNLTRHLFGLLKTDDAADRTAFSQHVHDLDSCAFHIMKHRVHPRREIAVSDKSRGRYDQASCGSQQT